MASLGHIVLVANPVAQNGHGAAAAELAAKQLSAFVGPDHFHLELTEHPRHATELAEQFGPRCDTLVVLGGDGIVHEGVNGLMRLPKEDRPRFGLIPVGSGNDFAATLGMSTDPEKAITQLLRGATIRADIGCCNGEYFAETLSFGVDAAIALGTVELRKTTGHTGTRLYLESGFDQLFHHRVSNEYAVDYVDTDGASHHLEGASHIFAVQMGPTYGGGFRICPDARLDDGLIDVCIAHAPLKVGKALAIFLMAKGGHHTHFKTMEMFQARSLTVTFKEPPACQIDGEPFPNTHFDVSLERDALTVIRG